MHPLKRSARRLAAFALLATTIAACTSTGGPAQAEIPLGDDALVGKFVWHDLITDDLAGAKRFYGDLFGWTYEDTTRLDGEAYTLVISGGNYIAGMVQLNDPESADYSRWLGYLSVADVDEAARVNSAAGGNTVVAPLDLSQFARASAVTDPQGAVLGLIRVNAGDPRDDAQDVPGHVVWNELLAADDSAAADFYRELAGYSIDVQPRSGGEYLVLQQSGRDRAGILQRPNDDIDPVWLTHFAVSNPAASASRADSLGGQVLLAPSEDLRGGSMALITDPYGAVLALRSWPGQGG